MPARAVPLERLHDMWDESLGFDALVVVAGTLPPRLPAALEAEIQEHLDVDAAAHAGVTLLRTDEAPGERLVLSPTSSLVHDHEDVRAVAEAVEAGIRRARDAGARAPVLVLRGIPADARYARATEVAVLAALGALWEPLEAREALGTELVEPVRVVGFTGREGEDVHGIAAYVDALDAGRRLARDLAGAHPERMTPLRFAHACEEAFAGTEVSVEVESDLDVLRADYPLLHAVARASTTVPRHRPCVVRLEWEGDGPLQRTLLLAGKGVTYDTGGADLKPSGTMAGMSRDKGGAAAAAGVVLTAARLAPRGLRIVAELGLVRNSVGADGFVTDEILVSHAGVRVRVGHTDAEGRLVLADLLSHLRMEALDVPSPHILSLATLTGHAALAHGTCTAALDNGPARVAATAQSLEELGDLWGEPVEPSRIRREDHAFVAPRTRADDVVSSGNAPSSRTPRGHQYPAAFLQIASALDQHGSGHDEPVSFTHLDLGGSACEGGDFQHGRPTAAPLVVLAARWLDDR